MRNGSYTSSTVSASSPTLIASVDRPTGPPPNCSHSALRIARSTLSRPRSSTPNTARPSRAVGRVDRRRRRAPRRSRAPGAAAGWRCGACRGNDGRSPTRPSSSIVTSRIPAARSDDRLQLVGVVVVEPGDEPEAVAQRPGDHAGAGGRADEREAAAASAGCSMRPGPCRRRCRAGSPPSPDRGSPRRRATGGGSRRRTARRPRRAW